MAKRLTLYILIAMIAGILLGITLNRTITDPGTIKDVSGHLTILTDLFLRLIKMIIAPLVFSTLVTGIAKMGDTVALGRISVRSIAWFMAASLLSLAVGLIMVHLLHPGIGLDLPLPPVTATSGNAQNGLTLKTFITHLVPRSFFEAMSDNEILQVVVFSLFTGIAMTAVGAKAAALLHVIEALAEVMLQITDYVMRFAPIAVFAAATCALAEQGPGILVTFGKFMGGFYLTMVIFWLLLLGLCFIVVGSRTKLLISHIRGPLLLAFTTASSEAAFPRMLEALDRFGVPRRVSSFVLPLGYSFNLDGTMLYCTFATMFIAQAYGIHLSIGQQVTMLLVVMVTSKGVAGVPRASLVVLASALPMLKLPDAGLLLVLAVDHFLDMGRSATNVVGNAVASTVVAKWEGGLTETAPQRIVESDPLTSG